MKINDIELKDIKYAEIVGDYFLVVTKDNLKIERIGDYFKITEITYQEYQEIKNGSES